MKDFGLWCSIPMRSNVVAGCITFVALVEGVPPCLPVYVCIYHISLMIFLLVCSPICNGPRALYFYFQFLLWFSSPQVLLTMVRGRSEINNKIRDFLTHKFARATARTTLAASAPVVGVSGAVGSTGHAAAFSRAIAQASQRVDYVLQNIEHDSNSISPFQVIVTLSLPKALTLLLVDYTEFVDYIAKVERYPNHRLPERLAPCTLYDYSHRSVW